MRLIDADEMLDNEAIAYMKAQNSKTISALTMQVNKAVHAKIQMLIADTPTVEAKPVVHGEWMVQLGLLYPEFVCSECRKIQEEKSSFCPNCGCDMRGEKHD